MLRRWLCLAGQLPFNFRARPLVRALPLAVERLLVRAASFVPAESSGARGAQPEPRAKPKVKSPSNRRGIANRLTSGGKAEPNLTSYNLRRQPRFVISANL